MKLATVTNSIRDFFFKPMGVESVAMLRILFGCLLLYNAMVTWTHLPEWWGSQGMVTLATGAEYRNSYSFTLFDFLPDDPRAAFLIAFLNVIAAIGVTIGFFSRTSMILAFVTVMSFHTRNSLILNSGDTLFSNILFFMIFTPAGAAYSVDRWIQRARGLVSGPPEKRSPWALRLVQIQFCTIYVATVLYKMKGVHWADGTAVYIATRLDETVRFQIDLLNNMTVIKFLTWSTLIIEFALGTLVWIKELRYWVLLAGVGLHIGIEMTMIIAMFEWVMMAAMVAMVDPEDIRRLGASVKNWFSKLKKDKSLRELNQASV